MAAEGCGVAKFRYLCRAMKSNAKTNPADPADKLFLPAKTALDKYLKANGMRRTPERYAILECICSFPGHFDMCLLHQKLEEMK